MAWYKDILTKNTEIDTVLDTLKIAQDLTNTKLAAIDTVIDNILTKNTEIDTILDKGFSPYDFTKTIIATSLDPVSFLPATGKVVKILGFSAEIEAGVGVTNDFSFIIKCSSGQNTLYKNKIVGSGDNIQMIITAAIGMKTALITMGGIDYANFNLPDTYYKPASGTGIRIEETHTGAPLYSYLMNYILES